MLFEVTSTSHVRWRTLALTKLSAITTVLLKAAIVKIIDIEYAQPAKVSSNQELVELLLRASATTWLRASGVVVKS